LQGERAEYEFTGSNTSSPGDLSTVQATCKIKYQSVHVLMQWIFLCIGLAPQENTQARPAQAIPAP